MPNNLFQGKEDVALTLENVTIRYKIGDFKDIGLKEWTMRRLTHNYQVKDFMAIDDVSFSLNHGDMLGIIGSNGAGKSTLLKAISGIMEPTVGKIEAKGKVVALLELASGFDGNLTVKENAYLRGAMLGYTREFMDSMYDAILDFSELRDFEQRPFKQLSSGMQSRLAFAIASMVQPDILILDEVLSVGDGAFREKSAKKMHEIMECGATTILVSHSLPQIRELCNKVLWLDHGKQIAFGDVQEICDKYELFLNRGNVLFQKAETEIEILQKPYDYIVVGAGLSGAVFACEMTKRGKRCLVLERRAHVGGNIYTEKRCGIQQHIYGPHIFHTSDLEIWNYVNSFAEFRPFINTPLAVYRNRVYNLPFNMHTFYQLWGIRTPEEARCIIQRQAGKENIASPRNLEQQALASVGRDIYETLIEGYTEKQWGRPCTELPLTILRRIPIRYTYNNNYYNDSFQGIPVGGYTQIIQKMLKNVEVLLGTDYHHWKQEHSGHDAKIFYTGAIDEYFDYAFGPLCYRSLRFETKKVWEKDVQGNAVINYTSKEVPYTRSIEHKHFEWVDSDVSLVTYEYPEIWTQGKEPYYPVNDRSSQEIFKKYWSLAQNCGNVIFAGRLGMYRYLDMDDTIAAVLKIVKQEAG